MRWAAHLWKTILLLAIAAQFLHLPLPAAMAWTTDLDSWLYSHVQSPMILALLVALILGTWIIPDASAYFRSTPIIRSPSGPGAPDATAREIFDYILLQSKWALGQDKYQDKLVDKIAVMLREAAAHSRLSIFGRTHNTRMIERIAPLYWADAELDPTTCYWQKNSGAANTRATGSLSSAADVPLYEDVQFAKAEIAAIWPPASWLALHLDKSRSDRR